jgi:hypothetical protein
MATIYFEQGIKLTKKVAEDMYILIDMTTGKVVLDFAADISDEQDFPIKQFNSDFEAIAFAKEEQLKIFTVIGISTKKLYQLE